MQWPSYLIIACFYDFQLFFGSGSSLGPVHVGVYVHKFDLHRKVTPGFSLKGACMQEISGLVSITETG